MNSRGGTSSDYRWRERSDEELLALAAENKQRTLDRIAELDREREMAEGDSHGQLGML